ncbi:MAG: hypothetical protein K9I84_07950 [Leadbetterella sp.]|nr:hypothetical protein [Leadbetterella sp.]
MPSISKIPPFLTSLKVKYTLAILALLLVLDLAFSVKTPENYSTVVLNDEGRILSAYLNNEDKWRLKTNVEEVSPFFLKAIIEKEDKYFYYYPKINFVTKNYFFLNHKFPPVFLRHNGISVKICL